MSTTTTDWLGNHVQLQQIEGTELTLVQWCRPRHGSWRGGYLLDTTELRHLGSVLGTLDRARGDLVARGTRGGCRYLRADLAGSPVDLEMLLGDLLAR